MAKKITVYIVEYDTFTSVWVVSKISVTESYFKKASKTGIYIYKKASDANKVANTLNKV